MRRVVLKHARSHILGDALKYVFEGGLRNRDLGVDFSFDDVGIGWGMPSATPIRGVLPAWRRNHDKYRCGHCLYLYSKHRPFFEVFMISDVSRGIIRYSAPFAGF